MRFLGLSFDFWVCVCDTFFMTDIFKMKGDFGRRVAGGDFGLLGWSFRLLLGPQTKYGELGSFNRFCGCVDSGFSVDDFGPGSVVCFVAPVGVDRFSYEFVRVTRSSFRSDEGCGVVDFAVARMVFVSSGTSVYVVDCDSALSEMVLAGLCPFAVPRSLPAVFDA